ncbi:MAG: hypothetical protein NTX22_18370 [Ignavibacteriales bacterium]|nr:hypothetical protein [Ignavibacteriales bacterium]
MKTILNLFCILILIINLNAQDDKYTAAIKKNMVMMDSAKSASDFQQLSNTFERIANAEKSKWLPYYYSAYCLLISSFIDTVVAKKDIYLDKADLLINNADSLKPDDSEILTLKGFSAQARMVVAPMERWQKYGTLSNSLYQKAKKLNPENPRPIFLIGQTILNTPEAFGGGKQKALPILKESFEKYNKFVPETSISPNWGKNLVEGILKGLESSEGVEQNKKK